MALEAKLSADIKEFQSKLKEALGLTETFAKGAESNLHKAGDAVTSLGKKLSIGLTGSITAVVTAGFALAKSTANNTSRLADLATVAGTTTEKLQEYRHVAVSAGVQQDIFADVGERLIRRLRDVGDEGSRVARTLNRIGVETKDASGNLKSSGDIIEGAILSLADMENSVERSSIGVSLFGRGWKNIAPMLEMGSAEIERLKEEAHDLGLILGDDAIQQSNQFGIAVDKMKFTLSNLTSQIGTALAPLLTDTLLPILEDKIVPALSKAAAYVGDLIKAFNALPQSTKTTVAGITGVAAALPPLLVGIGGVMKVLPLLGAGFTAVTGPVGIAVAAIAGAAVLIYKNWDKLKDNVLRVTKNLTDTVQTLFQRVKEAGEVIWKMFGRNITNIVKASFDTVITVVNTAIGIIADVLGVITAILKGDWKEVLNGLKDLFLNAFNGVLRIIANAQSKILSITSGLVRALGFDKVADSIESFNERVNPALQKTAEETDNLTSSIDDLGEGLEAVKKPINDVDDDLKDLTKTQAEYRSELNQTLASWGVFTAKIAVVTERFEELRDVAKGAGASLEELNLIDYREMGEKMEIGANHMVSKLKEAFGVDTDSEGITIPVKLEMADVGGSAVSEMTRKAKEVAATFKESLDELFDDAFESLFTNIFSNIGGALRDGDSVIKSVGKAVLSTMGGVLSQLGTMVIAAAKGFESVRAMFLNPLGGGSLGLIAGAALIAIGAAFKAGASKAVKSGGAGSSGYSGATRSAPVYSDQGRGALYNNDRIEVDFMIKNGNLVGAMKYGEDRDKRLG